MDKGPAVDGEVGADDAETEGKEAGGGVNAVRQQGQVQQHMPRQQEVTRQRMTG